MQTDKSIKAKPSSDSLPFSDIKISRNMMDDSKESMINPIKASSDDQVVPHDSKPASPRRDYAVPSLKL